MKKIFSCTLVVLLYLNMQGQSPKVLVKKPDSTYWNANLLLIPYRLQPPSINFQPQYLDLDGDGDIDVIKSVTSNHIPIAWIDDDDDMKKGDLEGDTDNDCLLIDRNRDGRYGALGDLIIDWLDTNGDQKADIQVVVEYPAEEKDTVWPNGHYMWMLDTDKDNVFNYIDWNTFQLKAWEHNGVADFLEDYSGNSTFMKVHAATNRMENLQLNWENPFLFYDEDGDGLSETAVRLANTPSYFTDINKTQHQQTLRFSQMIDWVSISVDLDNDNCDGNEFDYDFSLGFRGKGFNYSDQKHSLDGKNGLTAADTFFLDSRWRHLDTLVYADHQQAIDLTFKRGKWDKVYFVYDEDDDCNRWERVEFYDPLDPFKIGANKGGIDNHPQSDISGDRGEWDLDNSGGGKLYLSKFDGRLHLFGAELGYWRIDQTAYYYQGWDRTWTNKPLGKFATVKYEDADKNGFMDKISYDLNGDSTFETITDLKDLGIDDRCPLIDVSNFKYKDYQKLHQQMSHQLWNEALTAIRVAKQYDLNLSWYAKLIKASTQQKRYQNGYWLQFYIYNDLINYFIRRHDSIMCDKLIRAFYRRNWKSLLQ